MGECGGEENGNDWEMLISFPEVWEMLEQEHFGWCGEIMSLSIKWPQRKDYVGLEQTWARDSEPRIMDLHGPSSSWRA